MVTKTMPDTNIPAGRHVADVIGVLRDALSRIGARSSWESASALGEWRASGLGQRERRDGTGWMYSTMTTSIVIWRRLDGSWGAWTGVDFSIQPDAEDEGFTLNSVDVSRREMNEEQAKAAALRVLRDTLVARAGAYMRDASIIDERTREHQL
jgi:hypothetical protein